MILLVLSGILYFLGVILLFTRSFILLSNVFYCLLSFCFFLDFISSLALLESLSSLVKKVNSICNQGKIKGSIVYFSGLLLIIVGFSFIGAVAQIGGFFLIFRSFLPDLYDFVCRTPMVGKYLSIKKAKFRKLLDSKYLRSPVRKHARQNLIFLHLFIYS
jgi:hypothetical protein